MIKGENCSFIGVFFAKYLPSVIYKCITMGSTAKGVITGFICRLCSKMNRYVILIYGEEGERMGLADKINLYLPITVARNDPLPKTVCPNCVDRLEKHSRMVQMITRAESRFNMQKEKLIQSSSSDPEGNSTKEGENETEESDSESDSEEGECVYSNSEEVENNTV